MATKINKTKFKPAGTDRWGRKVFQNPTTKQIFKDVDGVLHIVTAEGEPLGAVPERIQYGFSKDEWNALNNMNLEYYKDQDFFAVPKGRASDTGLTELQGVEITTGLSKGQTQKLVMKYLGLLDSNKLKRAKEIRN